jgi:hypothetical protein
MADHLVPNQVLGFFEFQGEREKGEDFCFQRLAKAFNGADSGKLKMRRLPPTAPAQLQLVPYLNRKLIRVETADSFGWTVAVAYSAVYFLICEVQSYSAPSTSSISVIQIHHP